jgi:HK97 family phage prohead protease
MATIDALEIPGRFAGTQFRTAEIEHLDAEAGTVLVRVAPYGHEARVDHDIWEQFDAGAFAAAAKAPHRIKMWNEHNGPLIGHALTVEDRPDGSWCLAKFSNTAAARDARELALDGTLDQCSVTFNPRRDWMHVERREDGFHIRHSRAHMLGFALVPHGAYDEGAIVASVRDLAAGGDEARRTERAERERAERLTRLRALDH